MAGVGSILTQKIGPFPGYVWALAVGGVVFFLGPKLLKGSTSGAGTSAGTSGFDPQSFQAGWAQGVAYQGSGPAPLPSPQPVPGILPPQPQPVPVVGQSPPNRNRRDAPPAVGGASGRSASVGSKSTDPHSYFHPLMKMAPRYAHFAQGGVGGAAPAHAAAVHAAAHTAGIHPARLQILNPQPHKFIRIA